MKKISLEEIDRTLVSILVKRCQISHFDKNKNLFCNEYNISPRDFIYVINELEKELQVNMTSIFQTDNFDIMTINNLIQSVYRIIS
ncbi:hypothetical protein [uncultured Clostridium sp.]|uniref:hypothetical protein n=1 Tax=uncultured Clostridium sp. TaxID=59620 RepID=UPI0028EA6C73|nr:hypothetical protein [uncultured Clostridium sp.]